MLLLIDKINILIINNLKFYQFINYEISKIMTYFCNELNV